MPTLNDIGANVTEPGAEPVLFNPLAFGRNALMDMGRSLWALPGRAIGAARNLQTLGEATYDPAPAVDAALMTMGGTAFGAPRGAVGAGPGIRAYHGSPHDFERFDITKIGTGEGAQAYGHGLYFAEKEGTARSYRDALGGASHVEFEGKPIWHRGQSTLGRVDLPKEQQLALDAITRFSDPQQAASFLRGRSPQYQGQGFHDARLKAIDLLEQGKMTAPSAGRMYEVNINAAPEQFLDWDKPLARQAPQVRSVLEQMKVPAETVNYYHGPTPQATTGEEAYRALEIARHQPGRGHLDRAAASAALREAGIPGIKYLDQGSRTAGAGSSNYVVFNDKLIDILRKYALAGMAPPAALTAAVQYSGQEQR